MTHDEYLKEMHDLYKRYDLNRKLTMKRYAKSKSEVEVGDVFTDHIGSIRVDSIGFYLDEKNPSLIFKGASLKKNGEPRKDGSIRHAYEKNAIVGSK